MLSTFSWLSTAARSRLMRTIANISIYVYNVWNRNHAIYISYLLLLFVLLRSDEVEQLLLFSIWLSRSAIYKCCWLHCKYPHFDTCKFTCSPNGHARYCNLELYIYIYIYSFKGAIQLQKIREWHCHQTSNAEIARTVCGCGCGWLVDGEPVNILCIVSIAFHQIEALRFPRAAIHGIEHELCARELKILRWFLGNLCVWCDLRERQKCVQYMWWLLRIVYHVN